MQDTKKVMSVLSARDPFAPRAELYSLDAGVCAESSVNCNGAHAIGEAILEGMVGQSVSDYTFRKKDQVVTMARKATVQVGPETLEVDPQLLFQRLVTAEINSGELATVFTYEMCSYPPALFDSPGVLSVSNKAALAKIMQKHVPVMDPNPPPGVKYVLDGGDLLHRITWNVVVQNVGKNWFRTLI